MPRQARVVADGVPHHITQRGNNRQEVFLLDEDRRFYLDSLGLQARRHGVRLLVPDDYALPNKSRLSRLSRPVPTFPPDFPLRLSLLATILFVSSLPQQTQSE